MKKAFLQLVFYIMKNPVQAARGLYFVLMLLLPVAYADNGRLIDLHAAFPDFRANFQLQPPMEVPEPHVFIPEIPFLEHPLLSDEARRAALYERIVQGCFLDMELNTVVDLIYKQAEIEKFIEASLIDDGIPIESYWRNLNGLRSVLFSPRGTPLSTGTLTRYLREIARNGTRQSIPYRRVYRAIRQYDLFFDLRPVYRRR